MSDVQTVLVVGGGIGGLSATLALTGAGVAVDVVEKNPKWDVYGVGIIQPGNALRALNDLGLADEAVAAGIPMFGDTTWTGDGKVLLADHDWPALTPGLPPGNGITRPNLHRILTTRTLASGAEVRTGVTVVTLTDTGDKVEVEFSDGEQRSYDLVVGADGLYSQVRGMVFGEHLKAKFTGQVCWRYNLPRIEGLNKLWAYIGEDGTAGFCPLSEDLMYILTIEKPPAGAPVRLETEGLAETYRSRLMPFGGPIAEHREMIVDDEAVVYRPVENVLVPAPWFKGRVVLIGDAAHATSPHCGQGAAQAIEDGIVLSQELQRFPSVEAGLAAWMERRYERCRMVVEGSEAIGRWEQDHSLPIDPVATRQAVTVSAMAPY